MRRMEVCILTVGVEHRANLGQLLRDSKIPAKRVKENDASISPSYRGLLRGFVCREDTG